MKKIDQPLDTMYARKEYVKMSFDKYASCRGCPDRKAGCHAGCDGYQAREAEKQIRYDLRERAYASRPEHAGYFKMLDKRRRDEQMKGR